MFIVIIFVYLFVLLCNLLLLSSLSTPNIVRNTIVYIYLLYSFGKHVDIYYDIHYVYQVTTSLSMPLDRPILCQILLIITRNHFHVLNNYIIVYLL